MQTRRKFLTTTGAGIAVASSPAILLASHTPKGLDYKIQSIADDPKDEFDPKYATWAAASAQYFLSRHDPRFEYYDEWKDIPLVHVVFTLDGIKYFVAPIGQPEGQSANMSTLALPEGKFPKGTKLNRNNINSIFNVEDAASFTDYGVDGRSDHARIPLGHPLNPTNGLPNPTSLEIKMKVPIDAVVRRTVNEAYQQKVLYRIITGIIHA